MAGGSAQSAEGEATCANTAATAEAAATGSGKMGGVNEEEELEIERVKRRLEEVFSRQHLADDAFIQQHMNAQLYIPIHILESHCSFYDLAGDGTGRASRLILAAALRSSKLGVDETRCMVKPLMKPRRNTLILHDLPEGVGEEELRRLLESSPSGSSLSSVKPEVNRTAYVVFATDVAAQDAVLWLRSQKLAGKEIKCSMKSQHFVRSFFPATAPAQPMAYGVVWTAQPVMFAPAAYDPSCMEMWGDNSAACNAWPPQATYTEVSPQPTAEDVVDASHAAAPESDKGKRKGRGKSKPKGKSTAASRAQSASDAGHQTSRSSTAGTPVMGPSSARPRTYSDSIASARPRTYSDSVASGRGAAHSDAQSEDDLPCGYEHEFRQYTRQQIVDVCNRMNIIDKPAGFLEFEKEETQVFLFREDPCMEWAPEVTPQYNFVSTFLGDGRRSRGMSQDDHEFGRSGSRKSSSFSRRSRSQSGQSYQSHSGHEGDADWPLASHRSSVAGGTGGGTNGNSWPDSARARSARRSWPAGAPQQDYRYADWSANSGSNSGRHWVEKKPPGECSSKEQQAAPAAAESLSPRAGKRSSSASSKRWQPKAATEQVEDPQQPKSWADRVRQSQQKN